MVSKYIPQDWTEMRQALFDWAKTVAPSGFTPYWGQQDAPSPPLPRLRLNFISPPVPRGQDEQRTTGILAYANTVADSTDYTLNIGASVFTHNSGVGATAESIRDGLLVLVQAGPEPVTAEALGADQIRLRHPVTVDLSSSSNVDLKKRVETVGTRTATLSVELMVDPKLRNVTQDLETVRGSIESPVDCQIIQAGGWAVRGVEGTRKPDAVIGAQWQGRAGFDLRLGCRSLRVGLIDWIESAEINDNLPGTP